MIVNELQYLLFFFHLSKDYNRTDRILLLIAMVIIIKQKTKSV